MPTRVISEEVVKAETILSSTYRVLRSMTTRVVFEHHTEVPFWRRWFKKEKPVVSRFTEEHHWFYYDMHWWTNNGERLSFEADKRINNMFEAYEVRQKMKEHKWKQRQ